MVVVVVVVAVAGMPRHSSTRQYRQRLLCRDANGTVVFEVFLGEDTWAQVRHSQAQYVMFLDDPSRGPNDAGDDAKSDFDRIACIDAMASGAAEYLLRHPDCDLLIAGDRFIPYPTDYNTTATQPIRNRARRQVSNKQDALAAHPAVRDSLAAKLTGGAEERKVAPEGGRAPITCDVHALMCETVFRKDLVLRCDLPGILGDGRAGHHTDYAAFIAQYLTCCNTIHCTDQQLLESICNVLPPRGIVEWPATSRARRSLCLVVR